MRNPIYALRISKDNKAFLSGLKDEYGASNGLNYLIEAIANFCRTGQAEIDGIRIRQFFEDALSGRMISAGTMKAKLQAAEENEYTTYSEFLKGEFGNDLLTIMCEMNSAAEFFVKLPIWIELLQEKFLASPNGFPLRESAIRKYTERWYQDRLADGSATAYLKAKITDRMNDRRNDG